MKNLLFATYVFMASLASAQEENVLIAPGASLTKISGAFTFTEGPAADQEGNVYFTDQPNDRIWKWEARTNQISEFVFGSGRANGLYIDDHGRIVSCSDGNNELWQIDMEGNKKVLITDFMGKRFNGPNDLWQDKWGGIFFTDPYYKRKYWTHEGRELDEANVYYLTPDRDQVIVAARNLVQPNGIVGSRNGRRLFVADIKAKKTYCYKVKKEGILANRKLFVEMGSDGMTMDHKGNLYLTGKGVTIFDKTGQKVGHIDVPENWTANVTFGGEEHNTLFITAMGSIYTLKMQTKGIRW